MTHKSKIAVAISGGGRTLLNLLKKQDLYKNYEVSAVISSSESCPGVEIAEREKIPLFIFRGKSNQEEMRKWLLELNVEWIILAGFLKLMPVYKEWENKIINIHPALLPKFGGKGMYGHHVHEAVIAAKEKQSGATVHFVNDKYDEGKIIEQSIVPVLKEDNADDLAKRIFEAECELYPRVIAGLIDGKYF